MEKLLDILKDIQPGIDYENCDNLVDGHLLDSLSIISLIADLEDEFDITIPTVEIVPENFNSAKRIYDMIVRLQEEC
jgi:acyl carrier protein